MKRSSVGAVVLPLFVINGLLVRHSAAAAVTLVLALSLILLALRGSRGR